MKQDKIKKDNPPEKFFKGDDLKMATAIYKNDIQTIDNLVKQEHFNVNGRGSARIEGDTVCYTYLNYAVAVGSLNASEELLKLGADVNLLADNGGWYEANINAACSNKNKKMIELLIKYKENLNPKFCHSPITDLLMGEVDKSLIDLLLSNGADINYQTYIGGGVAVSTALNINEFDYVNYFLDKGANPSIIEYSGSSLALEIQSEIAEGRLSGYKLKEYTKLKERLVNQFHVKFPLKLEYRKGQEACIRRYDDLSQSDKDFLGKAEADRIRLYRDNLVKGVNILGQSIDSFENAK
ncbi:MAG: hypothetical protein J7539_03650 [Niabella sp.]|nr:hypothetical protein [Niabella sp.]